MISYKKRKLLVALSTVALLVLLLNYQRSGLFWRLLGNPCQAPVGFWRAQMDLGRSACTHQPSDNLYSVSRGVLKRNSNAPASARCYQWPSGVELPIDSDTSIQESLVNLRCRVLRPEKRQKQPEEPLEGPEHQSSLVLPVVPRSIANIGRAHDKAWNVLVLGLGGLTRHMWKKELPQTLDLLSKDFKEAIVTQLVPLTDEPRSNLEGILRNNKDGRWITRAFHENNFLTQAGVLHSVSSDPLVDVPAALNLSDFFRARSSLSSNSGCIGVAPEGSVLLSWLREGHLLHANHRLFSFLHFADIVFPSMNRLDSDLHALLLDFLHNPVFTRSLLVLYSLPDHRSGLQPGHLVITAGRAIRNESVFRWHTLQSAIMIDDFLTPHDLNRVLAFLASDDRPHHLADIGFDARTCSKLGIARSPCSCIKT